MQPAARPIVQVQADLRILRVLYFLIFAGIGVFWTFINVWYRARGLSGTQIGLINMAGPLVGIASMLVWGVLNDRYGRTRLLVMVSTAGTVAVAMFIARAPTFPWLLLGGCCFSLFASALIPILDSTTLDVLGQHKDRYGQIRVWGSVGYILTSASVGFVLERVGMHWMFPIYALVYLAFFLAASRLPAAAVQLGGLSLRGLNVMVRQAAWLVFAASVLLLGLGFSGVNNFVSITIKAMGGGESLVGLAWTVAALSELPVFIFSDRLLRRAGARGLVAAGLAMYVVRFVLYSIMATPAWALGIHAICGAGFGLYWIGAIAYTTELAPARLRTTSQSVLMSLMNLASVAGSLFTGLLFDQAGPRGLFQALALTSLLACVLFAGGQLAMRRRGLPQTEPRSA